KVPGPRGYGSEIRWTRVQDLLPQQLPQAVLVERERELGGAGQGGYGSEIRVGQECRICCRCSYREAVLVDESGIRRSGGGLGSRWCRSRRLRIWIRRTRWRSAAAAAAASGKLESLEAELERWTRVPDKRLWIEIRVDKSAGSAAAAATASSAGKTRAELGGQGEGGLGAGGAESRGYGSGLERTRWRDLPPLLQPPVGAGSLGRQRGRQGAGQEGAGGAGQGGYGSGLGGLGGGSAAAAAAAGGAGSLGGTERWTRVPDKESGQECRICCRSSYREAVLVRRGEIRRVRGELGDRVVQSQEGYGSELGRTRVERSAAAAAATGSAGKLRRDKRE
ncbi:hypothetical protein CEXT_156401, partial [Caerostris extrusa]